MHTKIKILCVLLATLVYTEAKDDSFIVGGYPAKNISVPYIVSVQRDELHWCGGVIINERTILTAAHCLVQPINHTQYTVLAGTKWTTSSGGTRVRVKAIHIYGKYILPMLGGDIALLRLSRALSFTANIKSIRLANTGGVPVVGTRALVCGWGDIREKNVNMLRCARVPIYNQDVCQKFYNVLPFILITKDMICAGYNEGKIDSCQGDSGGPLVAGNRLVGIVSFGIGCARPKFPGVYARIGALRPWVEKTLAEKYNETL